MLAAEASVQHLHQTLGVPTPPTAWKFIVASITYFQSTPGAQLPFLPNLTDFARVWTRSGVPGPLHAGAQSIAAKMAADFGIGTAQSTWPDTLERRLSTYFRFRGWLLGAPTSRTTGRSLTSGARNNWVGDGFEQILYVLTREHLATVNVPGLQVHFKVPPERIVGFQLRIGGGRQRFPVSDLAIANPLLRAVVSAKVGLRVDRTRGELDAALTLARVRPEVRYLIVTNEYDTGFLQLLASEPTVGRVYHVSKEYLLEFWRNVPGRQSELPWIMTNIADLADYFADVATLGRPAI